MFPLTQALGQLVLPLSISFFRLLSLVLTQAKGGVGGALWALLNAEMRSGSDLVSEALRIEERIKTADLIFSGEGRSVVSLSWSRLILLLISGQKFRLAIDQR